MRKPMRPKKDKKVFRRTAAKSKKININPYCFPWRYSAVTENCFFCFSPTCEGCPDQFSTFEREVKE